MRVKRNSNSYVIVFTFIMVKLISHWPEEFDLLVIVSLEN